MKRDARSHFWKSRGYACLVVRQLLSRAIGLAAVRFILSVLQRMDIGKPPHDFFMPGNIGTTALGDSLARTKSHPSFRACAAQLFEEACINATSENMRRLLTVVQQRFIGWQEQVSRAASAASIIAPVENWLTVLQSSHNPYPLIAARDELKKRLSKITIAIARRKDELTNKLSSLETRLDQELRAAEQSFEAFQRSQSAEWANASPKNRSPLSSGLFVALGAFFFLWIFMSVTILTALLISVVIFPTAAICFWQAQRLRQREGEQERFEARARASRFARQLFSRVKDPLTELYSARESIHMCDVESQLADQVMGRLRTSRIVACAEALSISLQRLESMLEREWDSIPSGPFREIDPGAVEIVGKRLADELFGQRVPTDRLEVLPQRVLDAFCQLAGVSFSEALSHTTDVTKVKDSLHESALEETGGRTTLTEALRLIRSRTDMDWDSNLQLELQVLHNVACSAIRVRPGVLIDENLSPETLSVGLPAGTTDENAKMIQSLFQNASIISSSSEDMIELIYDRCNLALGDLVGQALSQEPYDEADEGIRDRLWHFPPREKQHEVRLLPAVLKKQSEAN